VKKNVSSTAASRSRSTSVMPSGSVEGDNKNVENDEDIDAPTDDDKLYCICKTKYDEGRLMIACDKYVYALIFTLLVMHNLQVR
jgi:COMPASS component SPP1